MIFKVKRFSPGDECYTEAMRLRRRLILVSRLAFSCLAAAMAALVVGGVLPASAQSGSEHVPDYDIAVLVKRDGSIDVTETIVYDFGFSVRHGIFRDLYTTEHYDPSVDPDPRAASLRRDVKWSRKYPLDVISVDSPSAPDKFVVEKPTEGNSSRSSFGRRVIRIGDKNETISGEHTYTIRYTQKAVVNAQPGDDELFWDIVGFDWEAPLDQVRVTVSAETGAITKVACFTGPPGSTEACRTAEVKDGVARFAQSDLGPGRGMTIVAAIPDVDGDQIEPPKIVREEWSLKRAFDITGLKVAATGLLSAVLATGLGLLFFRTGRDRRAVGSATDQAFAAPGAESEPVALFEDVPTPVEFVPPDRVRPGQLGVLVDETADTVDVSATIVDLAVRGYLRIEEVADQRGNVRDHRLVRLGKNNGLLSYEIALLNGLFEGGPTIELSQLKRTFAAEMKEVKESLYVDAVERGWFDRRPDQVRQKWAALGFLALAAGAGVLIAAIAKTHLALLAAPFAFGGLATAVASRFMPRRTAAGTGAYRRAVGFRDFIENSEKHRAHFAERTNLFTEYLPYAIVFGSVAKWAKTFEDLGYRPDTGAWYVGAHPFSYSGFGESIAQFSSSAGTVLSAPAQSASGGSGFGGGGSSGGGGGGGGGGSW